MNTYNDGRTELADVAKHIVRGTCCRTSCTQITRTCHTWCGTMRSKGTLWDWWPFANAIGKHDAPCRANCAAPWTAATWATLAAQMCHHQSVHGVRTRQWRELQMVTTSAQKTETWRSPQVETDHRGRRAREEARTTVVHVEQWRSKDGQDEATPVGGLRWKGKNPA